MASPCRLEPHVLVPRVASRPKCRRDALRISLSRPGAPQSEETRISSSYVPSWSPSSSSRSDKSPSVAVDGSGSSIPLPDSNGRYSGAADGVSAVSAAELPADNVPVHAIPLPIFAHDLVRCLYDSSICRLPTRLDGANHFAPSSRWLTVPGRGSRSAPPQGFPVADARSFDRQAPGFGDAVVPPEVLFGLTW